jgi:hypothetical protein
MHSLRHHTSSLTRSPELGYFGEALSVFALRLFLSFPVTYIYRPRTFLVRVPLGLHLDFDLALESI